MKLARFNTTDTHSIDGEYLAVDSINNNTWLYDVGTIAAGAIAFSNSSAAMTYFNKDNTTANGYILCLGDVGTYSGLSTLNLTGDTNETAPFLFIGGGSADYDEINAQIANTTTITLTANAVNLFDLPEDNLAIGVYSDSDNTAYLKNINFAAPNGTVYDTLEYAAINPAYQGIGLPYRFWNKLIEYISLSSVEVAEQISCDPHGTGRCTLSQSCDAYDSTLQLSLRFKFEHSDAYTILPLYAFANTTANSTCELFV